MKRLDHLVRYPYARALLIRAWQESRGAKPSFIHNSKDDEVFNERYGLRNPRHHGIYCAFRVDGLRVIEFTTVIHDEQIAKRIGQVMINALDLYGQRFERSAYWLFSLIPAKDGKNGIYGIRINKGLIEPENDDDLL